MASPTAPEYDADMLLELEAQAAVVKAAFHQAGYASIEPPVLQPADVFLDRLGEDMRRRMYVFTDPGGEEVCLRPDLTIPTCRMYLSRTQDAGVAAKLCYNGTAFRYQKPDSPRPTEFLQAGIESIGAPGPEAADAEVLSVIVEACRTVGLQNFDLRLGDVGLFFALLDGLQISDLWRARLKRFIWQPQEFRALLDRLSRGDTPDGGPGGGLLHALGLLDEDEARAALNDVLDLARIAPVGGRTPDEIVDRLLTQAAEARADALPDAAVSLINDFLQVAGKPAQAVKKIKALTKKAGVDLDAALQALECRHDLMSKAGISLDRATFDADFGRNLTYYTGFVFELTVPSLGLAAQIAGGGRYDTLLRDLGAAGDLPAVGGMIRTERLLAALGTEGADG